MPIANRDYFVQAHPMIMLQNLEVNIDGFKDNGSTLLQPGAHLPSITGLPQETVIISGGTVGEFTLLGNANVRKGSLGVIDKMVVDHGANLVFELI